LQPGMRRCPLSRRSAAVWNRGALRRTCRPPVPGRVGVHRRLHRLHRPGSRPGCALRPVCTRALGTSVAGPDLRAGGAGPGAWRAASHGSDGLRGRARAVDGPSAVGHRFDERTHRRQDRRTDE
jgi:hypothetical protein